MNTEFGSEDVADRIFKLLTNENLLGGVDPFTMKHLKEETVNIIERELEVMPDSYGEGYGEGYAEGKDEGYRNGYDKAKSKIYNFLEGME